MPDYGGSADGRELGGRCLISGLPWSCCHPAGIHKIRVTGGKPLVRRGVVDFIKNLQQIPGIEEAARATSWVSLSTFQIPLYLLIFVFADLTFCIPPLEDVRANRWLPSYEKL